MLEVVKVLHTNVVLNGANTAEIIAFLRSRFPVQILAQVPEPVDDELIEINKTDWWEKNKHRVLAGARQKAGLTQEQLAAKVGTRQTVLSEYETGKRKVTPKMAKKIAAALNTYPEKFITS